MQFAAAPGVSLQRCPRAPAACQHASRMAVVSAASSADLAISVRGAHLTFRGRGATKEVLRGVDLAVPRGSLHILLGANGCGKSTLLRVLAGLITPDSGAVAVDRPYGMVFQNPDHQVVMPTVAADVAFGLGRYSLSTEAASAAARDALAQVGLAALGDRPTSSLSGGQKQRVAIAGALAEHPRVLLLDELTTFLDGDDQENVLACVRAVVDASKLRSGGETSGGGGSGGAASGGEASSSSNSRSSSGAAAAAPRGGGNGGSSEGGVTALWVTHRLEELRWADGVSYMDQGRVVFTGSPAQAQAYMRRLGAHV